MAVGREGCTLEVRIYWIDHEQEVTGTTGGGAFDAATAPGPGLEARLHVNS